MRIPKTAPSAILGEAPSAIPGSAPSANLGSAPSANHGLCQVRNLQHILDAEPSSYSRFGTQRNPGLRTKHTQLENEPTFISQRCMMVHSSHQARHEKCGRVVQPATNSFRARGTTPTPRIAFSVPLRKIVKHELQWSGSVGLSVKFSCRSRWQCCLNWAA